jgi:hypothetical protein
MISSKKLQRRCFILLFLSLVGSYHRYYIYLPTKVNDVEQQLMLEEEGDEEDATLYKTARLPVYYRPIQNTDVLSSKIGDSGNDYEKKTMTPSWTSLTYSDLIQQSMGLPAYTLKQVIDAADTFTSQYAIVVYDPGRDCFIGYYSQNHQWVMGVTNRKLDKTIATLTWLLRKLFPTRFTPISAEFVLALSGGDYPAVRYRDCIRDDRHQSGPCEQQQQHDNKAPILHFGSVFSRPHFFPNIIPMPMTGVHLNCFEQWFTSRQICKNFLPSYLKPGGLVFGEDVGLYWDDLIPQLVWRGTDFPFLSNHNNLEQPSFDRYVRDKIVETNGDNPPPLPPNEVATAILRENYHRLVPRWKGVVLTAESEIEALQTNAIPKINIKFSHVAGDGGRKRLAKDCVEYQGWEQIGFPVAGEFMSLRELARYKYHIDLGGGGGTSWTGFFEKLAMPGLLFHHLTPTKDYIHDLVEPWVHYVPVRSDLLDLSEKLAWAESHPEEARQISDTASQFMRSLGTADGFERIFQRNMVKPLRRVIEAYSPLDPTNEQHHGSFRQELVRVTKNIGFDWRKPFIKCSGETRFSCKLLGKWSILRE